jgi:hypothetical protein
MLCRLTQAMLATDLLCRPGTRTYSRERLGAYPPSLRWGFPPWRRISLRWRIFPHGGHRWSLTRIVPAWSPGRFSRWTHWWFSCIPCTPSRDKWWVQAEWWLWYSRISTGSAPSASTGASATVFQCGQTLWELECMPLMQV